MPYIRADCKEINGVKTACHCPRCGKSHFVHFHWTGRGTPRVFCVRCKATIERNQALSSDEPEHALFAPHYARSPALYHEPKPAISEMSLIPHYGR